MALNTFSGHHSAFCKWYGVISMSLNLSMVGPHWEAITILVGYSDNISAVIVAKDTEESQSGN